MGSTVFQVFDGAGTMVLDDAEKPVHTGDLIVVPSWSSWSVHTDEGIDLFAFSDAPIVERLHFARTYFPEGA